MTTTTTNISSLSIRAALSRLGLGLESAEFIGTFYHPDHEQSNDWTVRMYGLPGGVRVADTNGDPIWEEGDPLGFAALLEEYGL